MSDGLLCEISWVSHSHASLAWPHQIWGGDTMITCSQVATSHISQCWKHNGETQKCARTSHKALTHLAQRGIGIFASKSKKMLWHTQTTEKEREGAFIFCMIAEFLRWYRVIWQWAFIEISLQCFASWIKILSHSCYLQGIIWLAWSNTVRAISTHILGEIITCHPKKGPECFTQHFF
jgi:hypothetical protein